MITNAVSSAWFGLQQNMQRFNQAADRIANPDTVAGVEEIVSLKTAEHGIKVNAAVMKIANEVSGYLVDILA